MAGLFEGQESAGHLFSEKLGGIPVVIWVALGVVAVWIYESRKSKTTTAATAAPGTTGSLTPAEYAQAYYAENPTAYVTTPVYITSGVGGGGSSGTGLSTGGATPITPGRHTPGKRTTPNKPTAATTPATHKVITAATPPMTSQGKAAQEFVSGQGVSLESTGKLASGTFTTKTGALVSTITTYAETVQAVRAGTRVGYVTASTGTIVPITSVTQLEKLEGTTSATQPGKGKQTTTYRY